MGQYLREHCVKAKKKKPRDNKSIYEYLSNDQRKLNYIEFLKNHTISLLKLTII